MGPSNDRNWHQAACVWANDDRFRIIFDAVRDAILISDLGSGRFIEANQAGLAMFGYSMDELIGSDIGLLCSGVHPYTHEGAMEKTRQTKPDEPLTFEWQCKKKDGTVFWVEVSISYAQVGPAPCIVATLQDISKRKRQDKQLNVALQKMSAANDAKSHFLASMSHELRTPLNAIIGFSDLMLGQPLGPLGHPRYREYMGDIHQSGERLLALINDVLDLARLDAGNTHLAEDEIFLPHLIAEVCRTVESQVRKGDLQIHSEIASGLPPLRGDIRRIRQIVLNLLSNAVKFTPAKGTISIDARETVKGLVLRVRDTGIGIAKEDVPAAMERFGQTDSYISRKYEGSGLGLPLAKQLVELHGGSLTIESDVNAGTCVTVTFPPERIVREASRAVA